MQDNITSDRKKLKILILSAPVGSGHRMAANALAEAFSKLPDVEVVQGNVFDFFPSVLGRFVLKSYAEILRIIPALYAFSYRWSNRSGGSVWIRDQLNAMLLRVAKSFIDSVQPDLVFSTHATPTGILSLYKEKYNPKLWLGVVVTDFTVHRWLLSQGADAYFLADKKLIPQVCGTAVAYPYGIPVRNAFSLLKKGVENRNEVRRRFGWNTDAFICLLLGGGGGMLPMESILQKIKNTKLQTGSNANPAALHVIALTGDNKTLYRKISAMKAEYSGSGLAVLGFTDDLPKFLQGADLVISKAGGVSLAECLACGKEVVIFDPLPGQEMENASFVQREYGIRVAADTNELIEILRHAIAETFAQRMKKQEQRRMAYGHPDAAAKIAALFR